MLTHSSVCTGGVVVATGTGGAAVATGADGTGLGIGPLASLREVATRASA